MNIIIDDERNARLADFGLARPFTEQQGNYTNRVITLWYRPPELLLGSVQYGPAIDMWSAGSVFILIYSYHYSSFSDDLITCSFFIFHLFWIYVLFYCLLCFFDYSIYSKININNLFLDTFPDGMTDASSPSSSRSRRFCPHNKLQLTPMTQPVLESCYLEAYQIIRNITGVSEGKARTFPSMTGSSGRAAGRASCPARTASRSTRTHTSRFRASQTRRYRRSCPSHAPRGAAS